MPQRVFECPEVKIKTEQSYIGIPLIREVLDRVEIAELINEVFNWLQRKRIEPVGKAFCRYWVVGGIEEKFNLEVGVPIGRMAAGDDRVIASFIPGGSYAIAMHHGSADTIENSAYALEKWTKDEGLELDKRYEQETEIWNGRFDFFHTIAEDDKVSGDVSLEIAYLLMRDDAA